MVESSRPCVVSFRYATRFSPGLVPAASEIYVTYPFSPHLHKTRNPHDMHTRIVMMVAACSVSSPLCNGSPAMSFKIVTLSEDGEWG